MTENWAVNFFQSVDNSYTNKRYALQLTWQNNHIL